jgi:alkaline phosphatase
MLIRMLLYFIAAFFFKLLDMKRSIIFLLCIISTFAFAQNYPALIFAHNDYEQPVPFFNAYRLEVSYIEIDIFLKDKQLFVAHHEDEINKEKTLDDIYLKPLSKEIAKNGGYAYPDKNKTLDIMIDLKTDGVSTLNMLVKKLQKYPQLINSPTLFFTISGNVPDKTLWKDFPLFINFDGRPGREYSKENMERIRLISSNFRNYTKWGGKGVLAKPDEEKIRKVINEVHSLGKKIRFYGAPDFTNAWIQFMDLGVDVLNSDKINELSAFLKAIPKSTYQNNNPHTVYNPNHQGHQESPKNIILLIGDGMGLSQIYSGYNANKGQLNLFNLKNIGFSITTASDSYITDSAAGATAMATGKKTRNRYLGLNQEGDYLEPITDILKNQGFRTAIISNGNITDATPAAFYAHQSDRSYSEAIAADFLLGNTDIIIGSGMKSFKARTDGIDLTEKIKEKGYKVLDSHTYLEGIQHPKFIILDDEIEKSKIMGRGDILSRSLTKSVEVLTKDGNPFFMMLESGQIDSGGHENNMEYLVREMLDFDQVIGEAMKFADNNKETLIIITADHETGGLSLIGGDISKGYVHGNFSTIDHTAVMVPVFAYGPGSDLFRGVYQNTEIFYKILEALKIGKEKKAVSEIIQIK